MTSLFSARRKPKRIAREDPQAEQDNDDTGPVVRRPGAIKAKSKLRVSFNPGEDDGSTPASESDGQPQLRSASRLGASAALQDRLRETSIREDERPSYSKSYLDELRNSTPSTPARISTPDVDEDEQRILDIETKFGAAAASSSSSSSKIPAPNSTHIPSATEIAEKKARRARLALSGIADPAPAPHHGEQEDYIPLESYDSDGEFKPQRLQLGTFVHQEKTKDSRLEREDEDIAEGFEQFIEDDPDAIKGRYTTASLHIGSKATKAFERRQREEMRNAIENAEVSHSDTDASASESDSDHERRQAYESAQTHRGLDGLGSHSQQKRVERRPKQPRETVQIVKLSVGLAELRGQVVRIEGEKERVRRRLEEVRRERVEVAERKRHVQGELDKLGSEVEGLEGERARAVGGAVEEDGSGHTSGVTGAARDGTERNDRSGVGIDGDAEMG